jgi:inorganic triphosphatase YgiF
MRSASESEEQELKFELDPSQSAQATADSAGEDGSSRRVAKFETVYFDTPGFDLRQNGLILRVRHDGKRYMQTIKRQVRNGLPIKRWESEREISGPSPDITVAEGRLLAPAKLKARQTGALSPVFVVKSQRTSWLSHEGEAALEYALDEGEIVAGGRSAPLRELEIEVKSGSAKDLFAAARRLAAGASLRPTIFSKDERGYRLLDQSWGRPVVSRAPELTGKMGAKDAFRAIAHECVQHFMLNELVIRRSCESDAVHQARIALRRLRSALTFFEPIVRDGRLAATREDLKWLSDRLGCVRDLDVFQSKILTPRLAQEDIPGGRELGAHIDAQKLAAHRQLVADLASQRCRDSLLSLLEWIEAGDWVALNAFDGSPGGEPIGAFAEQRFRKKLRRVAASGDDLCALDDAGLHEVRKRAKKLRYAGEFLLPIVRGDAKRRAFKALIRRLDAIQSNLGKQHDVVAGRERLAGLAREALEGRAPDAAPAMFFAAGRIGEALARENLEGYVKRAQKAACALANATEIAI